MPDAPRAATAAIPPSPPSLREPVDTRSTTPPERPSDASAVSRTADQAAKQATPAGVALAQQRSSAPLWLIATALFSIYVIWGSTYLAIKYAVEVLPPLSVAGARFLISGIILFLAARLRGGEAIGWPQWRSAAIVGVLLLLGGNGLVCWAEKHVSSGVAAVLVATVPLWFVGLEWGIFGGAPPTLATIFGICVGLSGVVLLINPFAASSKAGVESVHGGGAIALLFACFFWAGGSLYSRRAQLPKSAILSTGMQMLCGGAALVVVGLLLGEFAALDAKHFTPRSVGALLYLITFGSLIGFTAYGWLLKNVSPTVVSTYAFVNPAVAVFLGWMVHETQLTARTAIAIAVILLGVGVITLSPKRKAKANAE
ncbi:MAG: EamA family transporter [Phycisphaerae bacterium]|nr:EamA family transporter [Phycisphaerae bacterium]